MIVGRERVERALPGYAVGERLGSGTFGLVLAGTDQRTGRPVAVKVMEGERAEGTTLDFAAEARVLAGLDHPHVVRAFDYVEAEGLCLVVMELLAGGTLSARRQGMGPEQACAVGLAVAAALGHAHGRGVLHRDIKADNILFAADGTLKVGDFGIAKLFEGSAATASGLGPRHRAASASGRRRPRGHPPAATDGGADDAGVAGGVPLGVLRRPRRGDRSGRAGAGTTGTAAGAAHPARGGGGAARRGGAGGAAGGVATGREVRFPRRLRHRPRSAGGVPEAGGRSRPDRRRSAGARPPARGGRLPQLPHAPGRQERARAARSHRAAGHAHREPVTGMAFSPDQSLLATFSYDGSTSLWDTTAQGELARPLATLGQPRDDIMDEVLDARFSPDGRLLATNSNGSVRLWDTSARDENVQPRAVLPTGTDFIKGMKLSPDGKLLATITGNDAAQLWATDAHGTVQPVATLGRPGEVLDVEFSPNGELVAVANLATIQLWSTATRDQNAQPLATLTGHTQLATDVVFSPDGELVVAVSAFSGSALVWKSAARSENVAPLVTLADVAGVRFSQDGKLFAAYGGDTVRLWDIGSLNRNAPPVATYSAAATDFHDLVYSPDSAMFATLSRSGGSAFLWDATARGQNIAPLATMVKDGGENSPQDFDLGILGAVFSPDGRLLVTASSDTAQLWDADARGALKPLAALPGEPSYLYDTVFSPDGKLLATSSYDNNALLWDFDPGRLVAAACAEQANRLTEAEWKAVVPDAAYTPPCS